MLDLFRIHAGQKCSNPSCGKKGDRVIEESGECTACGGPLVPDWDPNWRVIVAAALGLVIVLGLLGFTLHLWLGRLARERQEKLLAQASARLEESLEGATAADVDRLVAAVQSALHLTETQRQQLVEMEGEKLASLPRLPTPEIRQRLESLLREAYADGTLSPEERDRRDRLVAEERLVPEAADKIEQDLAARLEQAHRHLARGKELVERHRISEARHEFLAATESDPQAPLAWANLGAAEVLLGQTEQAREAYRKSLELDPGNWLAHFNLALLAARGGDREEALEHLEKSLASLPATATRERRALVRGVLHEPALATVRDDPRVADLLSEAATAGSER